MKTTLKTLLLAALCAPLAAEATDGLSYRYFEGGAGYVGEPVSEWGGYLEGSAALNDNFHILAGLADVAEVTTLAIGLGFNPQISERSDFVARVTVGQADGDRSDTTVYGFSAGIRGQVNSRLELEGGVSYADTEFTDGETSAFFGGLIEFTPTLGLSLGATFDEESEGFSIGLRGSF